MAGNHLFLAVLGDPQVVHSHRVVAERRLLTGFQQDRGRLLVALTRESEEHQHDADMNDVAAISTPRASDEADRRGKQVGAGAFAANDRSAPELLPDRAEHEARQHKADARRPDANAKSHDKRRR